MVTFLHPLLLLALIVLPIAYWMIRVNPPVPRRQIFPPLRLLKKLSANRKTALQPPIWLLLLRLTALAAIILGFAQPIVLPKPLQTVLPATDLAVILDDGAFAAPNWRKMQDALYAIGQRNFARGHSITLYTTASRDGAYPPPPVVMHTSQELSRTLSRLTPVSWVTSRGDIAKDVSSARTSVLLISDGVASPSDNHLSKALETTKHFYMLRPDLTTVMAITHVRCDRTQYQVTISRLGNSAFDANLTLEDAQLGILATQAIHFSPNTRKTTFEVQFPSALKDKVARMTLTTAEGRGKGPATVYLFDTATRRHPVGLLTSQESTHDIGAPLFFLQHALPLVAELHQGPLAQLLPQHMSVIVWPSQYFLNAQARANLQQWVQRGGTLIRFASSRPTGPTHEADPPDPLLPVRLSDRIRDLDGVMSWEQPQGIAPWPAASPFTQLKIPSDIFVKKTIIAQPDADLPGKVWARLNDGTPLVTNAPLGKGTLVLFHVDSTPDWSTLAISGLFPDMLEQIIQRSAGVKSHHATQTLAPLELLDFSGTLTQPEPQNRPLTRDMFINQRPNYADPPGLYGAPGDAHAYNLGPFLKEVNPVAFPKAQLISDRIKPVYDSGAAFLLAGLALLCLDLLLRTRHLRIPAVVAALMLLSHVQMSYGQDRSDVAGEAARMTRLAYVVTGDPHIDAISHEGLIGLSHYTSDRTSAVLASPEGVKPGVDDLAFYPLIYWPISATTRFDALRNAALDHYLKTGGMLLIDVASDPLETDEDEDQHLLSRVTRDINIPALTQLTEHHILAHCFYILHSFPGRVAGKPVWVALNNDPDNDAVSPIIIGSGQWAQAWAVNDAGEHPYAVVPGEEAQRTQAERFGVNVIIYALTGNYKKDQMQVPELLRRLKP